MTEAKNILQRINAVQLGVDYIQKERKSGMNYSIVSHDAVTAKVRPLMVKHGIVYYPSNMKLSQNGNRTEMQCEVIFASVDNPADNIAVATAGYGIDAQDKGVGKAISYAVKYALLKALGLETGDDPDLDQGAEHKPDSNPVNQKPSKTSSRAEYDRLARELEAITRLHDLDTWRLRNTQAIEALPDDWKDNFRNSYIDKQRELKASLAA